MSSSKVTYPRSNLGREPQVASRVYEVLARTIGLPVSIDDIVKESGLGRDQVINSLTTLRTRGFEVETVIKGSLYRLLNPSPRPREAQAAPETRQAQPEPERKPIKRMFEEIGVTRDGVVIIQDDEGTLFKAEEL